MSTERAPTGRPALKWSATVNPRHAYVVLDRRGDFSGYNALEIWVKPEVEDGTYALDVRVCVWDTKRKRGAWFAVGSINHHTAPNYKWTRLVFYLGEVPWRDRTLRPVDIVAWGHSPHHGKGERLVLLFGGFRLLSLGLERSGLLLNGGFEGALVPWKISDPWRKGEAALDEKVKFEGKSSLKISSPQGRPSKKVVQRVEVRGGRWYRLRAFVKGEGARGVQLSLTWHGKKEPVVRTYPRLGRGVWRLSPPSGTFDWTEVSRLLKAPPGARFAELALQLEGGGTAWFDGLFLGEERPSPREGEFLRLLGMPPKRRVLFQPEVEGGRRLPFEPQKGPFRLAFSPTGKPFSLRLCGPEGEVEVLRADGRTLYALGGRKAKALLGALKEGFSVVVYISPSHGLFALNLIGVTGPWWGPFHLPQRLEATTALKFEGRGRVAERLLVEGPLWTPEEIEARRKRVEMMGLKFVKGTGWMAEGLPPDLREKVEEPTRPSPWAERATIFHTALPFGEVLEALDRIKAMGFNTICLRPVQETGIIGFGSGCCVQDYFSVGGRRGSPEELRRLVKEAHRRGMKVIFWLVPNHAASSNPLLMRRPELFSLEAGSFWSQWEDVVDFDYRNPETWRYMAEVGRFWIREFGLDGFGLDVPDLIPRNFFRYFKRELERAKGGDVFILAESSGRGIEEWGMDVRYGFLSGFKMDEIFGGIVPPPKPPQKVISSLVKRLYPFETREAWGLMRGGHPLLRRAIKHYGPRFTKCVLVTLATLPLVPHIAADAEILRPHARHSPYALVPKLLRIREEHPCLKWAPVEMVEVEGSERVCAYLRRGEEEAVLVVVNFSPTPTKVTLRLPADLSKAERELLEGREFRPKVGGGRLALSLPPFGARLLLFRKG